MKKKIVALVMCMVLLVAVSITGTLAYLTSQDTVTNTFTVGNVKITMDETDVDQSTPNQDRDKTNSYKLLPGGTYTKDPIIHVDSNSEDCYLVVYVDNQLKNIETATSASKIANQMAARGWKQCTDTDYGDYWYYVGLKDNGVDLNDNLAKVSKSANVELFTTFTVNANAVNTGSADNTALNLANYNNKTIVVKAFAIQADNVEALTISDIVKEAAGVLNPSSSSASADGE